MASLLERHGRHTVGSALGLLFFALGSLPLQAQASTSTATSVVGTCKPSLPSYANISAAVAAAPTGATVQVCPGTYPEQVTIDKGLTLQGISSANSAAAILVMPGGGFVQNATLFNTPLAAQLLVQSPDPVNVTSITVDGTGGSVLGDSTVMLAGIVFQNSSGVLNRMTTRNHINPCTAIQYSCGFGIVAQNQGSSSTTVTIQNSSVQDADNSGILAFGDSSSLAVTIKGNSVDSVSTGDGIKVFGVRVNGNVTGNFVTAGFEGIRVSDGTLSVSGNTVANTFRGIVSSSGPSTISITSNKIFNASGTGIVLGGDGNTVQSNSITQAGSGIDFSCHAGNVDHNTINAVATGIAQVPGATVSPNTYFNVGTIRTGGC